MRKHILELIHYAHMALLSTQVPLPPHPTTILKTKLKLCKTPRHSSWVFSLVHKLGLVVWNKQIQSKWKILGSLFNESWFIPYCFALAWWQELPYALKDFLPFFLCVTIAEGSWADNCAIIEGKLLTTE